jgi:hypothetical protein
MKANEMHYFSYLFDKVLYMFWTGPLSIIRSILTLYTLLLLPGAELPLNVESFGLLIDFLLPFPSVLDAGYPVFDLHLANVLFDVILPSVLGSFL